MDGLFPCGFNTVMDATVDYFVNVVVVESNAIMHHGMEGSILSASKQEFAISGSVKS